MLAMILYSVRMRKKFWSFANKCPEGSSKRRSLARIIIINNTYHIHVTIDWFTVVGSIWKSFFLETYYIPIMTCWVRFSNSSQQRCQQSAFEHIRSLCSTGSASSIICQENHCQIPRSISNIFKINIINLKVWPSHLCLKFLIYIVLISANERWQTIHKITALKIPHTCIMEQKLLWCYNNSRWNIEGSNRT